MVQPGDVVQTPMMVGTDGWVCNSAEGYSYSRGLSFRPDQSATRLAHAFGRKQLPDPSLYLSVSLQPAPMPKKVRTGCGTCKARKLKCDETKPACLRCTQAKLLCAGYLVSVAPRSHVTDGNSAKPLTTLRPADNFVFYGQLSQFADLDHIDYAAYDFCRQCTVHELSSRRRFWTTTVLAGAEQDPAVLHALLALASVHRTRASEVASTQDYDAGQIIGPGPTNLHYYKAVSLLRRRLSENVDNNTSCTLIVCLILLSCDLIQSRYGEACLHLTHGRQLLQWWLHEAAQKPESRVPLTLPSSPADVFHELAYEFASLDIQSANFGSLTTHFVLNDGSLGGRALHLPHAFTSLDDAWRFLLILHNGVNHLAAGHVKNFIYRGANSTLDPSAVNKQGCLLSMLRDWYEVFQSSALKPLKGAQSAAAPTNLLQYASCQLLHAYLTVAARTALSIGDEMAPDSLLPQFAKIIALCEELVPSRPRISIDTVIVQPLFILGCYCRHPTIRRRCLQVLSQAGVEGHWDSRLVKLLTQYRMETEEEEAGYVYDPDRPLREDPGLLSTAIPAPARYTFAFAFFLDSSYRHVEIQLQRRKADAPPDAQLQDAFEIEKKIVEWPSAI